MNSPWDKVKVGDWVIITKYYYPFPDDRLKYCGLIGKVRKVFPDEPLPAGLKIYPENDRLGVTLSRFDGDCFQIIPEEQAKSEAYQKCMRAFYNGN